MKKLIVLIIAVSSLWGVSNTNAQVAVGISVGIAPPALPVYVQPPCPVEGYLWTPGYWGWGDAGYFWVPGVWCRPARIGFLWTPGYWGWEGGHYWWHGGYWGPHVGYYGGINYGYGYGGHGFYGGRWEGGAFRYNTAAWHVGPSFHNTYMDRSAVNNAGMNHSSFNGPNGVNERPNAEEQSAMHEQHMNATSEQMSQEHSASASRGQLYSVNHGSPSTTARASVGGQRFNSSGHAMQSAHAANMNHTAQHANGQAQHGNYQRAGGQQMHGGTMQNRGGGQRQSRPAGGRASGGGRNMGGGGRGGRGR